MIPQLRSIQTVLIQAAQSNVEKSRSRMRMTYKIPAVTDSRISCRIVLLKDILLW